MASDLIMEYALRVAEQNDFTFCYKLAKRNMTPLFTKYWGGWDDSKFHEGFEPRSTHIVLVDDAAVGYISLKKDTAGFYLDNIQLCEQYTGRGLGTALLHDVFRRHPNSLVRLTTFEDNPAFRLYRRLGFHTSSTDRGTVYMQKYT